MIFKKINFKKINLKTGLINLKNNLIKLLKLKNKKNIEITFATKLTIFRLICVPVIIASMLSHYWGLAFLFFILASVTDFLDGYIARNYNQESFLGACLDPIADKLLILSIYFTLAFINSPLFNIPKWFVWLVLFKELILILGAGWLLFKYKNLEIRPSRLGKLTMLVQVLFIIWLFSCYFFFWVPVKTYYFMLGLVFSLVVASLGDYFIRGLKKEKVKKINKKLVILIFFISGFNSINLSNNKFLIVKDNIKNKKVSSKRLREDILAEMADSLKKLIKLDKLSLKLKELFLEKLDLVLNEQDISLLNKSNNKENLKENLQLLEDLNNNLDENILFLKNKLIKVKNSFVCDKIVN